MTFSDCEKCFDTQSTSDKSYEDWTQEAKIQLAAKILGIEERELERALQIAATLKNTRDLLMDEQRIREHFESHYLGNNKQLARRNEHEDYVLPSIQNAWAGWLASAKFYLDYSASC